MNLFRLILLLVFVSITGQELAAQRIFFHRQRTCNKFCLQNYNYEKDKRVASVSVVAKADAVKPSALPNATNEKRFHVPVSGIKTDRVTFRNIAVHINDAGEVRITGKLDHNGGPDQGLTGSNVRVAVKAYAGVANAENLNDAAVMWKLEDKMFCYKGRIKDVSILGPRPNRFEYQRVFAQITHVEIELEHEIDR